MMRYLYAYVFANFATTILMVLVWTIRETMYIWKTGDAEHTKRFNRYVGNTGKMTWKDWIMFVSNIFITGWIRGGWLVYKYYEFLEYEEAQKTETKETRG